MVGYCHYFVNDGNEHLNVWKKIRAKNFADCYVKCLLYISLFRH